MDQPTDAQEPTVEGDAGLATRARARLGRRHARFVVAQVVEGERRVAAVGVPLHAEVEVGSVAKGFTGLLLADARGRGEVGDDTVLGDLLPLDGTPAASVRLGALATHRSGLPGLAKGTALRPTWDLLVHGRNPYGQTLEQLLEATRRTPVGSPRPRYSNLGFMLLGHAVAAASGTTYAALLHDRVLAPLGLLATTVPAAPDELSPDAVTGRNRRGRPVEAWTGEGLGPAGGIRSTAADLARTMAAMIDGSAPGATALDPVAGFRGRHLRIGAAWLTFDRRGTAITWHNGGTGGFRSIVALDRRRGAGVAVVTATTRSVDGAGMALLRDAASTSSAAPDSLG